MKNKHHELPDLVLMEFETSKKTWADRIDLNKLKEAQKLSDELKQVLSLMYGPPIESDGGINFQNRKMFATGMMNGVELYLDMLSKGVRK